MRDMESNIPEADEQYPWPTFSVYFVVLPVLSYFAFVNWIAPRLWPRNNGAEKDVTGCDSPECVRCNKYKQIKTEAFSKLCEFSRREKVTSILERLFEAVEKGDEAHDNPAQRPNVLYVAGLEAKPWWDKKSFERDIDILENSASIICEEYRVVSRDLARGNTRGWRGNNTSSGQWTVFHLYNQGVKVAENCLRCPETSAILDSLEALMKYTVFFNASFSVLQPGTLIDEHYGPTNTRLRCHLGLLIPDGCKLTVSGIGRNWKSGRCIVFDDSFLHEAENRNCFGESRVVFMVDFWHPQLSDIERMALDFAF